MLMTGQSGDLIPQYRIRLNSLVATISYDVIIDRVYWFTIGPYVFRSGRRRRWWTGRV